MNRQFRHYLIAGILIVIIVIVLLGAFDMLFQAMVLALMLVAAVSGFFIIRQYLSILKLRNEQKKAQLQHLQSQVNPHFLFNTINNVYGLVDLDPGKAKELLLGISDLMRYNVYESGKEFVTLEQEIEFLNNYIELNKVRYHRGLEIQFDIDIDRTGYQILPLMLIILVENAFKHGVEKLRKDAFIHVSLMANEAKLTFTVENNFEEDSEADKGIGLNNLRTRLDLAYGKKHQLDIAVSEGIHKAELILQL